MQDEKQFEQLILLYTQLKNGSEDIRRLIDNEDYDTALTSIKTREPLFLNAKCIRNYLELTPVQEIELNKLLDELKSMELENMKILEEGLQAVKQELKRSQQTEKIQQAYDFGEIQKGSIINYEE